MPKYAQSTLRSLLCATALLVGACGGGGSTTNTTPTAPETPVTPVAPVTPSGPSAVTVGVSAFDPGSLTVATGTTVKWTWASCSGGNDPYGYGETCISHGVTWDAAGATDSPTQSAGTYQRQFTAPGTYAYHCPIHGAAMSGTITVQ